VPTRIAGVAQGRPGGVEMDALPVPIRLEHGEPKGGLAGAENPADQPFSVFDTPETVTASADIELVRRMVVRKRNVCACAAHRAPRSMSKSETSAQVKRSPSQNQKQRDQQEAFEASSEPVATDMRARNFLHRETEGSAAARG
jgi:hypothetical protein